MHKITFFNASLNTRICPAMNKYTYITAMRKLKYLFSLGVLLLVWGCSDEPSIIQICQDTPQICQALQKDTWCKRERKKVLFTDYYLQRNLQQNQLQLAQTPTDNSSRKPESADDLRYKLLLSYEGYAKCMKKASLIEHKKLKEKKTMRINNYMAAMARIQTLSDKTLHSENPLLLYYHWSRHQNTNALAKLLQQEGSASIETAESQFNLATYYIKRDLKKTFKYLFHALELHQPEDELNTKIFRGLATLFVDKEKYKQGYVWLKVLNLADPDDLTTSEEALDVFAQRHELNQPLLDKIANNTLDKIENGQFTMPSH